MTRSAPRRLRSIALIVLTLFTCILSACSSSSRTVSGNPTPTPEEKTTTVTFVFDLLQAKGEVPVAVTRFGFFGFADTECQNQIYTESVAKDKTLEGDQQKVTLDIPIEVVKVKICYYDTNDKVLLESTTETLELTEGEAQTITIKDSAPPKGANVTLTFDETVVVPTTSTACQVNMFDADGNKAISAYSVAVDPQSLQDITVTDVPTNVATIELLWLDADGVSRGSHRITEIPELAIGETAEATVSGQADMDTSDLTLTLNNVWNDNSLTAADVHLVYKSECVTEDARDVTGTLNGTTCTAQAEKLLGLNIEVLSVTLSNQKTEAPFEWLDYGTAQAASEGSLTLDVDKNEFAGGSGTDEDPYLLANPRQFCNIDNHLEANFKQIADIDFTGTCGIAIDDEGNVSTTDSDARYYNEGAGLAPLASDTAFSGTYDGGTFAISGVVVNSETGKTALFSNGSDCTFKNVTIDDTCRIKSEQKYTAALVAQLDGTSSLEKCTSNAALFAFGQYAGGLVARCGASASLAEVSFTECAFGGTIRSTDDSKNVGGIVAYAYLSSGKFQACTNTGDIQANGGNLGGIIGVLENSGQIDDPIVFSNCSNSGNVQGGKNICGGICGQNNKSSVSFVSCTNSGELKCSYHVAGILGQDANSDTTKTVFNSCTSSGQVTATRASGEVDLGSFVGFTGSESLVFEGNNSAECVFVFSDSAPCVGGAIGSSNCINETSLRELMTGHVTVSDACAESVNSNQSSNRGKYCGSPWIDSL